MQSNGATVFNICKISLINLLRDISIGPRGSLHHLWGMTCLLLPCYFTISVYLYKVIGLVSELELLLIISAERDMRGAIMKLGRG